MLENEKYLKKLREKFELSLKLLIESNLNFREYLGSEILDNKKIFINEFATINFKSCRKIGHTKTAIKVCSELFDNVLYLGYNHSSAMRHQSFNKEFKNVDFFSIKSHGYRGHCYNCVIIDPYSVIKKSYREEAIRVLSPLVHQKNFTILLLG